MDSKEKEFKCKECGMIFNDRIHFERHTQVHKTKHSGFVQKWYWEN